MVTITLAAEQEAASPQAQLVFRIPARAAMLAGSRNGFVEPEEAERIVTALSDAGFSFLVGCATGVDACFRLTLAEPGGRRGAHLHRLRLCGSPPRERIAGTVRLRGRAGGSLTCRRAASPYAVDGQESRASGALPGRSHERSLGQR